MRTIRFNTFETNSSSCHSVTVFKNAQDWKDFKEKKVYIRRDMFDMQEHEERLNIINSENKREYIRSIDELYDDVKDCIENDAGPLKGAYSHYNYNEGLAELEMETYKYLIKNFNKALFEKILFEPGSIEVCKLEKPINVTYDYGSGKTYIYDVLTINDFYDYIFGGLRFNEMPSFYVYGECDWDEHATVEEYIKKDTGEEMVVVTRDEEC